MTYEARVRREARKFLTSLGWGYPREDSISGVTIHHIVCGKEHRSFHSGAEEKEKRTMTTSKDRVEFHLCLPRQFDENARALAEAMNITVSHATRLIKSTAKVRCRPSQFARFIIARERHGVCVNGIKNLSPNLVRIREEQIEDLSARPNRMDPDEVGRQ